MRVLIAAPDQLLVRHGGLRTQVERTVEELRRLGCEITLFNSWERYHLKKFDVAHVFSMNAPLYYKAQAIANYGMPLVFSSVMWRAGNPRFIRLSVEMLRRIPKQLINDVAACREMSAWAHRILPNTDAERQWLGAFPVRHRRNPPGPRLMPNPQRLRRDGSGTFTGHVPLSAVCRPPSITMSPDDSLAPNTGLGRT